MYTNKEMLPYGLEKYHPFFFPEALPKWTVSVKSNVPPERPQKALITLGKKMYHLRDLCKYQNMRHGETLFERRFRAKETTAVVCGKEILVQITYHQPQTWLPMPLPLNLHTVLFLNQPSSEEKCQGKRRNSSTECEQFVQADACAVR